MAEPHAFVAVYVFLEKEDKVCMMRRANTSYRDGWRGLPAGHVEGRESLMDALKREAREETGVELNEADLDFIHATYRRSDRIYADYFFKTQRWEGEPRIMEPHKCDGLEWVDPQHFLPNTVDEVRNAWRYYTQGQALSEIESPGRE